jgi:hypothetical protein
MLRKDCYRSMVQVSLSHRTALQAVALLIRLARDEPRYLRRSSLNLGSLQDLLDELHDVYFIRIFACFESALRHFWRATVRDTRPPTEQLLSLIAARRSIPQATLDAVHEARQYRNFLIHEEHEIRERMPIEDATAAMNAYLARSPLEW